MRNTLEYPVTTTETLETLHDMWAEEFNQLRFGSMRPLIISLVRRYIEANGEDFQKFIDKEEAIK